MNFTILLALGALFGVGFGYLVQRAGLCFAVGLAEVFMGHGRRIARMFALIFAITAAGFFLSGLLSPSLGLKPIGQIRGYGFYNIMSGILFGAGIMLNGGCILGTLRQIGEGNLTFVIILLSFIPGMALVVHVLNPFLGQGYAVQKLLLPEILGVAAPYVSLALAGGAALWFVTLSRRSSRGTGRTAVRRSLPRSVDERESNRRERQAG